MNKEELKKLQAELNSISEKKFSKRTDKQLAHYDSYILPKSEEHKKAISKSLVGKKVKPETIKKLKEKGILYGSKPAWNKGIIGIKGNKHSEETKKKMSESAKGKIISNKQKKIVSEKLSVPIIATNLKTGKQITFKSTKEAKEKLKLTGILHVLKGRSKQCGGYYFEYKNK